MVTGFQLTTNENAILSAAAQPLSVEPATTTETTSPPRRVLLVGSTGTIGRATVQALLAHGHEVVCFVRAPSSSSATGTSGSHAPVLAAAASGSIPSQAQAQTAAAIIRHGNVRDPESIARDGFRGEHFDAVVSCMASRTGAPRDAWAIDHQAHMHLMHAAINAGVTQFVLLSAICVQKPKLAFQHAKLAFERELMQSPLTWSIVRPTAYFKSISGQVARVQRGKPFLIFGDGELTACKPISDRDLSEYMADCLHNPARHNQVLPIGGPGDAITPRQQGEHLFSLLKREPKFKRVPVAMLDAIIAVLGALGKVIPPLADKAELARIGRYYATESMLVWDAAANRYDAAATPSAGRDTLFEYYAQLVRGESAAERGEHAVF